MSLFKRITSGVLASAMVLGMVPTNTENAQISKAKATINSPPATMTVNDSGWPQFDDEGMALNPSQTNKETYYSLNFNENVHNYTFTLESNATNQTYTSLCNEKGVLYAPQTGQTQYYDGVYSSSLTAVEAYIVEYLRTVHYSDILDTPYPS